MTSTPIPCSLAMLWYIWYPIVFHQHVTFFPMVPLWMAACFYQRVIESLKCVAFFILSVREQLKDLTKQYDKSENDLKALQSVGQVIFLLIWHRF